jgi:hypothetical protein
MSQSHEAAAAYRLLGLTLQSEIDIHAPRQNTACPDVTVRLGARRAVDNEPAPGRVFVRWEREDRPLYSISQDADGSWTLRVHGVCDFEIGRDLRSVTCNVDPEYNEEHLAVLLTGTVPAFLLERLGKCVLHGSSTLVGERAFAFVGLSGMGKSTLTAQFCVAGARLITDDVLPLNLTAPVTIEGRSNEVRLRREAYRFIGPPSDIPTRVTADERVAVQFPASDHDVTALHGIVVPWLSRDASEVVVEQLSTTHAVYFLSAVPRIMGCCDPAWQRRRFEELADLAAAVPVYRAFIPWDESLAPTVVDRLVDELGLTLP